MQKIPTGLKILRLLSYVMLTVGLIGIVMLAHFLTAALLFVALIGMLFYATLILAIHKKSKSFLKGVYIFLGLLIFYSLSVFLQTHASHVLIRILLEIYILYYLWSKKDYFSN